jgi:predicted MFS family arabinose efflux permease
MENSFGYGSDVAGAFGLIGVVGALAASYVGKLNDRMSGSKIIYYSAICLIVSWIVFFFSGESIVGLIIGVILIDLGAQALQITNQNIIFSKNPDARNRVNTIYMVSFFIGGALGTLLAGYAWQHYGWKGVSTLGLILSIAVVVIHGLFNRKVNI